MVEIYYHLWLLFLAIKVIQNWSSFQLNQTQSPLRTCFQIRLSLTKRMRWRYILLRGKWIKKESNSHKPNSNMSRGSSMSSLSKRSFSKIDLIRLTIIKRKIQTTRQSKTISGTKGWRWRGSRRRRETSSKRYGLLKERKRWKLLSRRRLSSRGSESKQLSLMRWNAKRN